MVQDLIDEAARRGRDEVERQKLQEKINEAYAKPLQEIEAKRRREEQAALRREQRSKALFTLKHWAVTLGWFGLFYLIATERLWEEVDVLEEFFLAQGLAGLRGLDLYRDYRAQDRAATFWL